MRSTFALVLSITLLFALMLSQTGYCLKWEPYQFKGNEKFEFKIEGVSPKEKRNAYYALDIKKTNQQDEKGEALFEVTYTTRGHLPQNQLGAQTAFGFWSVYGMSLSMAFLNPAYSMFFMQMDLNVGEKMSFFGAGIVEVTGKEKIAGRDGFKCVFKQQKGTDSQVAIEWVIDPELGFPLKSILYDKGKVQSLVELTKYTKY